MAPDPKEGFAIWITGLPASGKSTLARALAQALSDRGVRIAVLESDLLRRVLTPDPRYDETERSFFYRAMVFIGGLLTRHGVNVIFDATAHRRSYRDQAREQIASFLEIYVDCPVAVCMDRDPKGIYRRAREGQIGTVPGLQVPYEPPLRPDLVFRSDREAIDDGVDRILGLLRGRGLLHQLKAEG